MTRAKHAPVVAVFVVGVLVRVCFVAAADNYALVTIVPDDAFYGFQVARHIAAGHGSTFDGIHPTNGYHPLWPLLVLPIHLLTSDPVVFVKLVLGLGIMLSFLAALLLYRTLRSLASAWYIPFLGVILYYLNPRPLVSSLNGLETSLSTFLFALALYRILPRPGGARSSSTRAAVLVGLLLGLLLLTRTDNVFFVAALFAIAVATAAGPTRVRRGAVIAATCVVVVAPWVLWSWLRFGTPVQCSGVSVVYASHELYRLAGHSTLQMLVESAKRFLAFVGQGFPGETGFPLAFSATAALFSLVVFAVRWRDADVPAGATRHTILALLSLSLGALLLIFAHVAVRWFPRPWYFDQVVFLAVVVFCVALGWFDPDTTVPRLIRLVYPEARLSNTFGRALMVVAVCAAVFAPTIFAVRALTKGDWPWSKEMLDAAHWLKAHTDEDETAAAFNAGIIGFFSNRHVVNLDGAINNAAYRAMRRKELMLLMRRASVRYYLDFEPVMLDLYGPFLGDKRDRAEMTLVQEIDRSDVTWCDSTMKIYRLTWPPLAGREGPRE